MSEPDGQPVSKVASGVLLLQRVLGFFESPAAISEPDFIITCTKVITLLEFCNPQEVPLVLLIDVAEYAVITFIVRVLPVILEEINTLTYLHSLPSPGVIKSFLDLVDSIVDASMDYTLQLRMAGIHQLLYEHKDIPFLFALHHSPPLPFSRESAKYSRSMDDFSLPRLQSTASLPDIRRTMSPLTSPYSDFLLLDSPTPLVEHFSQLNTGYDSVQTDLFCDATGPDNDRHAITPALPGDITVNILSMDNSDFSQHVLENITSITNEDIGSTSPFVPPFVQTFDHISSTQFASAPCQELDLRLDVMQNATLSSEETSTNIRFSSPLSSPPESDFPTDDSFRNLFEGEAQSTIMDRGGMRRNKPRSTSNTLPRSKRPSTRKRAQGRAASANQSSVSKSLFKLPPPAEGKLTDMSTISTARKMRRTKNNMNPQSSSKIAPETKRKTSTEKEPRRSRRVPPSSSIHLNSVNKENQDSDAFSVTQAS